MADDNVGLGSPEKDAEPPTAKAPAMDDLSMYSDESILTSSVKRNNMVSVTLDTLRMDLKNRC